MREKYTLLTIAVIGAGGGSYYDGIINYSMGYVTGILEAGKTLSVICDLPGRKNFQAPQFERRINSLKHSNPALARKVRHVLQDDLYNISKVLLYEAELLDDKILSSFDEGRASIALTTNICYRSKHQSGVIPSL